MTLIVGLLLSLCARPRIPNLAEIVTPRNIKLPVLISHAGCLTGRVVMFCFRCVNQIYSEDPLSVVTTLLCSSGVFAL